MTVSPPTTSSPMTPSKLSSDSSTESLNEAEFEYSEAEDEKAEELAAADRQNDCERNLPDSSSNMTPSPSAGRFSQQSNLQTFQFNNKDSENLSQKATTQKPGSKLRKAPSFNTVTSHSIPLIFSISPIFKRFLKVFILTYGLRSTLSIISAFITSLRKLRLSPGNFIKGVLVHDKPAPYEAAMRVGLFCSGICTIYEGAEMLIRWIWFRYLRWNRELVKKQRVRYQQEKLLEEVDQGANSRTQNQESHTTSASADPTNQQQQQSVPHNTAQISSTPSLENDEGLSSDDDTQQERIITTNPRGERVQLITKTKTIEYAPRMMLHTALAGFASGLALLVVKDPETKRTASLYFFARLLQCIYNALQKHHLFHKVFPRFKHYDSLIFILSSGQIMYSYAVRRFALPPSYLSFITKTGPIHPSVITTVEAVHTPGSDLPSFAPGLTKYLSKFYPAEKVASLVDGVMRTESVPCSVLHPQRPQCSRNGLGVAVDVARKIFPLYASLTFVPLFILQFKKLRASPLGALGKSLFNACRSTLFLSAFVSWYQMFVCLHHNITPGKENRFLYWLAGIISGASIFIEQKSRRSELALYTLPRALDSLYLILKRRRWLASVPAGELLLFCLSLSGIMSAYHHQRDTLGSLPRYILKTLFSNKIVKWIE